MRKTAIIPLDASWTDQRIATVLQPWKNNILEATLANKPDDPNDKFITIHYDDGNGKISDDVFPRCFGTV